MDIKYISGYPNVHYSNPKASLHYYDVYDSLLTYIVYGQPLFVSQHNSYFKDELLVCLMHMHDWAITKLINFLFQNNF